MRERRPRALDEEALMPRARNIKPGFFKNEELAELGPYAMLLFEGLWCLADKAGRLEDRPRRIKAEIFPYFDVDVDDLLNGLHDGGFIVRYEVAGSRYLHIINFTKHQSPHVKEAASTIPAPDKPGADTMQAPPDSLIPDSLIADTGLLEGADARKPKRARSVDDWLPSEADLAWSQDGGYSADEVKHELAKFTDHFTANGKPMKDWSAAWRNWMRRSREFAPSRASPNGRVRPEERRPSIPSVDEVFKRQRPAGEVRR
jgi:hypothetical protein